MIRKMYNETISLYISQKFEDFTEYFSKTFPLENFITFYTFKRGLSLLNEYVHEKARLFGPLVTIA